MKTLSELAQPISTAELDRPELRVRPNQDLATELGISTEAIAEAVRIATIGDVGPALARFNAKDRQIPIRVQMNEKARSDLQLLQALKVRTSNGNSVPSSAMAAGLMMVFSVLVLLFSSFLQPITILFSLPLSIGGAIIALAITQNPISLPVVIGIIMLMGIVTKNAIMLVDFAVEEIARGVSRTEAIVDAGRKRARPIVMTTIAMCGGMRLQLWHLMLAVSSEPPWQSLS